MASEQHPLKVFLCHSPADKPKVRELYRYLRRRGIRPWLDETELMGGQVWEEEIQRALETSDAVIICLTQNSVSQEGYNQGEMKFALDKALEMPEGRIFLIPARFEECEIPRALRRYQRVDLFTQDGYQKLIRSLQSRSHPLPPSSPRPQPAPPLPPRPEPQLESLPTWVVLLLNLVVVVVASILLGNRVVAPCVSAPLVSAVSVVLIALMVFHVVWRFAYPVMSRNPEGMMELPIIRMPVSALIGLVNAIHPWKVGNKLLLIVIVVILAASGFLNLHSSSPFYAPSQPFTIQGFSVQRAAAPEKEQLASGETLTMSAGESVILELLLLGDTRVSCSWSIQSKGNDVERGCSINYLAITPGADDILSVFVQPVCSSRQEAANLFISILP